MPADARLQVPGSSTDNLTAAELAFVLFFCACLANYLHGDAWSSNLFMQVRSLRLRTLYVTPLACTYVISLHNSPTFTRQKTRNPKLQEKGASLPKKKKKSRRVLVPQGG